MRVVFMGTPEFATTILKAIHLSQEHEVVGVVTVADKPAGRGQKLSESSVKQYAIANELPLLQPEKLKSTDFLTALADWNGDIFVVVAFRMLPKEVWSIPPKGTINLHGSLLPKYRGAAPINWAVINGDTKTGVTTFYINEAIDTGDVLKQAEMAIWENETAGEVHDRMMHLGASVVLDTLNGISAGTLAATPQQNFSVDPTPAPKIFKTDCRIDFSKKAAQVHNLIRGMSPYPGAWIKMENKKKKETKLFKIYRSLLTDNTPQVINTATFIVKDKRLYIQWSEGELELLDVQFEGKRRILVTQFLQGFTAEEWQILH
jgi:methionyl-tRNA formyltransferase